MIRRLERGPSLCGILIGLSFLPPLLLAAPEPPKELPKGEDAVLLEETLEIDIATPTSARMRYSNRTQVLTARGAERYDFAAVNYSTGVRVVDLQGTVISPAGKRADVKKQMIADRAQFASYEMYSDSMFRTITFPAVIPGSTIEYSWELEVSNFHHFPKQFDLQEEIPSRQKTLIVRSPASLPVRLMVRGDLHPVSTTGEKDGKVVRTYSIQDVPPLHEEPDQPPDADLVPTILIRPGTITWGEHHIDLSTWAGVGRFVRDIERDRDAPDAAVAEKARSLTASLSGDPDAKIRAVYEFVQSKINYVAISLDIGGWQPHASGDVLSHMYGDCKDKAALMIAMLRAIGITACSVTIRTRDVGLPEMDAPGLTFNHAIVAIPRDAGGYLFLDPTSEAAPFGDLPWTDQGVPVLVVREDGSVDLVETPLMAPEKNRRRHTVTASVRPDGTLEGTYVMEAWGVRRQLMSEDLGGAAAEREDHLANLVAWLSPGAVVKEHQVKTPSGPTDPLRIEMRFEVPHYVTEAGSLQVVSPEIVRLPSISQMAATSSRLHPVFFPFLIDEEVEIRLTLPRGRTFRKMPPDRKLDGPGVAATTRFEMSREGDRQVLVVHRTLVVSRREIPIADYPALRKFVSSLAEEEAYASTLVPAT
jgi:hypothetical protein